MKINVLKIEEFKNRVKHSTSRIIRNFLEPSSGFTHTNFRADLEFDFLSLFSSAFIRRNFVSMKSKDPARTKFYCQTLRIKITYYIIIKYY